MPQSTSVLPSKYHAQTFRYVDPRFYAGKELIIPLVRKDSSSVLPENAVILPLVRRVEEVTLRRGSPMQTLYGLEDTRVRPHIPGKL